MAEIEEQVNNTRRRVLHPPGYRTSSRAGFKFTDRAGI
jgi:hypothetical protein